MSTPYRLTATSSFAGSSAAAFVADAVGTMVAEAAEIGGMVAPRDGLVWVSGDVTWRVLRGGVVASSARQGDDAVTSAGRPCRAGDFIELAGAAGVVLVTFEEADIFVWRAWALGWREDSFAGAISALEVSVADLAVEIAALAVAVADLEAWVTSLSITQVHTPVITASSYNPAGPISDPTPFAYKAVLLLAFTPNLDAAYRQTKISQYYNSAKTLKVHWHWTKSTDALETGHSVLWRVSVSLFAGDDGLIEDPIVVEHEDTYLAADTTARRIYRSPNMEIGATTPGWYAGIKVEALTPAGTPLTADPALYSVDMTWEESRPPP